MNVFFRKTFLALMYSVFCLLANVDSICDGSDPPTLKRVTFDKIVGRWFTQSGIKVFPNEGIPGGQFMSEFNLDFQPNGKLVFNGRTPYKPQKCLYNTLDTRRNRKPSSFYAFAPYLNKEVEMRILDTDFKSYILVWMCFRCDSHNKNQCTDWLVDLLTKRVDGHLSKKALWFIEVGLKRTICRRNLRPRIPDPKRICKRVSKSYGTGYGRKKYYW